MIEKLDLYKPRLEGSDEMLIQIKLNELIDAHNALEEQVKALNLSIRLKDKL